MSGDDWDSDDSEGFDEDSHPALVLIPRFIAGASLPFWFSKVGQPLVKDIRLTSRAWLDALGFPHATAVSLRDWREASEAAESTGIDDPAFEAEEQLRAALTDAAIDVHGEDTVSIVLTHVAAELGPSIGEAALNATRIWGLDDMELVNAAAGAGIQACHNAALLILAGRADEDHPFALKYRLFESGRWPVALIGSSMHLF
jgi:hypothetical protein